MPENLIEDCVGDLTASLGFLTRLPMARTAPVGGADIGRAAWAFPIAGIVVGLIGRNGLCVRLQAGIDGVAVRYA